MLTEFERAERVKVPDYGQVGAGTVVDFIPRKKPAWITRPRRSKVTDDLVSVTVSGDSLIGDGIQDGDRLTLRLNFEASEVRNGRPVVVSLPDGALAVKHFFLVNGREELRVRLAAANPAYEDMEFGLGEVEVKALVIESTRSWT